MTAVFGDVEIDITPRIYGASELGVLSLTAPGDAHPRVVYVGGELFVGLDRSTGGAITQGDAAQAAAPFDDTVAAALPQQTTFETRDGLATVTDETQAAAVLLTPANVQWPALEGDPVVFALSREQVVVVGSDDEAGVATVLDLIDQLFEAGGPLVSAHPIVLTDGAWAPFAWHERFPALDLRIQRALRLFSVRAYEAQSVALARPDVHIADPKIHVREDGVTLTFAAWPKGTATLLPVVDNVMIADPSGTLSVATMDQFLDAGDDAIVRTGLSPARYFVPGDQPR
ncbi:hypothetical protein [Microbacterium sp. bgisy189]|uniref:hypothetical protein n=1 Tax=Microbacterium sp. bgisy189 TaxID=3413798 RepID=UPI003EB89D6A